MPEFRQYDPDLVTVVFGGTRLRMFVDDSFISGERATDSFTKQVGAQGDVTRTRNRDKSGSVTVTLQHSSPSNDFLSSILQQDEQFGTGVRSLMVRELNGTTLLTAQYAWIRRIPNLDRGNEVAPVEWMFDVAFYECFIGGTLL